MTEPFKLARAPIIEAVVDIDCAMPAGFDLAALQDSAREKFREPYSTVRQQLVQEFQTQFEKSPKLSIRHGLQALQFLQKDEKQLIQVRAQGFSFNRLAPYGSLDEYLPEIERTWNLFRSLASPAQVRVVRLRFEPQICFPDNEQKIENLTLASPDGGKSMTLSGRIEGKGVTIPCAYHE
jgi:uncharacterized protein (TIGR04255 family)